MKISCLQENLAKGLSIVGRAVSTKSTLPVVSNVLLATEDSRLKLSATNLEVGITCWIGAKVDEEGAITVPARLFSDLVNSLPPEKVDMVLNTRTRSLNIHCGAFEANLKGIDAEEFPPIPKVGDVPTAQIKADELRQAINQVAFAAATDDTRPVLTGVLMTFDKDKVVLAAADGFRLAVRELQLSEATPERLEILVPARALLELSRILGDSEEPVQIMVTPNKSQVLFHMINVDLVSRLIDGTFPNYKQIIPTHWESRVVVNNGEFAKAVRIASFVARDAANVVKLQVTPGEDLTPGKVIVTATAAEVGDTLGGIDATVEGEGIQIAFNAKYVSDVLSVLDTPQVALELTTPSSPGVLKNIGKEDYIHVIMPMHTVR
ncbi:MAG: DNA polymerase III subunit beta [Chloroflexi bacterium]|nr:DNA polymerase III subunit beta [Chloroflexota bacterium]MCL5025814.1 DNA polymerase III subunit beta [Chloroflexota bacterium]